MSAHAVVERLIAAPPEVIFDLVHDYSRRLQWDTLLRDAYVVGGGTAGVDVDTVCTARWLLGGFSFRTRYVTFSPPTLAAVTLVDPVLVFRTWSASIRHKPVGDATLVRYTMTFTCRPGVAARLIEAVAVRMFRLETARRLAALDAFLTSAPAR